MSMIPLEQIRENVLRVQNEVAEAAIRAGRDPASVRVLAATKTNDSSHVQAAIGAGIRLCGENRVQELTEKLEQNAYDGAEIHFIGHLQRNKARQVVGRVGLVHSVASWDLAQILNRLAGEQGLRQDILLEVNIGGEASKSGLTVLETQELAGKMPELPNLRLRGLMTIPPVSESAGSNRRFFAKMYALAVDISGKKYDNVTMDCLSMGMSGDFADAIAEGATIVRLGSAIFGPRG